MTPEELEQRSAEYRDTLTANMKTLEALEDYPALQRALRHQQGKLYDLLRHIRSAPSYAVIDDTTGTVWYAVQYRDLARHYGGDIKTWRRMTVLLEVWGLIERAHDHVHSTNTVIRQQAISALQRGKRPLTWYYVPLWTRRRLQHADALARQWNVRGRAAGFGKGSILAVYGQEIADRVFGDTRTESAVQTRLQDRINAQALDQITRQGFTRKCDLINVDVLEEQKAFARWRSQHPEYRYGAPTRDHRHRFTLDDQRWIITDDNKE